MIQSRSPAHVKAEGGLDQTEIRRLVKKSLGLCPIFCLDSAQFLLVEISKNPNAEMAYTWYEEDVVQRYDVVMEGWTAAPFINPSAMSTSLPNLRTLMHALQTGECAFRNLLPAEAAEHRKKWDADVAASRIVAKHRAERCDKGSSRKWAHNSDDKPDDEQDDRPDTNGTTEDGSSVTDPQSAAAPRPRKRMWKSSATASSTAPPPPQKLGRKSSTRTAPRACKDVGASTRRDDATTCAAVKQLANNSRIKSRAVITSEDKLEADPEANEEATDAAP
jgi:hypothetical protein